MENPVDKRNYIHSVFRAVGYPVDAQEINPPKPEEALKVALEALVSPEARTAEAAVAALLYGVLRGCCEVFNAPAVVLQRAGYASERVLNEANLSPDQNLKLKEWINKVESSLLAQDQITAISWSNHTTSKRMERLVREQDDTNKRWKVYGNPRLREEVLSHVLNEACK